MPSTRKYCLQTCCACMFSLLQSVSSADDIIMQTSCPPKLKRGSYATIKCIVNVDECHPDTKQIYFDLYTGLLFRVCSLQYPPTNCKETVRDDSCGCVRNEVVGGRRTYEIDYRWKVETQNAKGRMRCEGCLNAKPVEDPTCRWGLWAVTIPSSTDKPSDENTNYTDTSNTQNETKLTASKNDNYNKIERRLPMETIILVLLRGGVLVFVLVVVGVFFLVQKPRGDGQLAVSAQGTQEPFYDSNVLQNDQNRIMSAQQFGDPSSLSDVSREPEEGSQVSNGSKDSDLSEDMSGSEYMGGSVAP